MTAYPTTPKTQTRAARQPAPVIPQALLAISGAGLLFTFALLASLLAFNMRYAGQIYPGVSIGGVDLSGLQVEEAAARLTQRIQYPLTGKVAFQEGNRIWVARPVDLGFSLDARASAQAAYELGRRGDPISRLVLKFEAWYVGKDLSPRFVYNQQLAQSFLANIAAQVYVPVLEASLAINGVQVTAAPGQVGRELDQEAAMSALEFQIRSMTDGIVLLKVIEKPPALLDASQAAETARKILSAPLVISLPEPQQGDPGPWTIDTQQLALMTRINRVDSPQGASVQVGLDPEALRTYVTALASNVARLPQNGRFSFDAQTRQLVPLQPSIIGRDLDIEASLQAIHEKLAQGEHAVQLAVKITQPEMGNDASAEKLGITQVVSQQTTYFYGSSAERIQNITTAAARFNGVLVAPGATFSMADVMGDVSLDNGYAEALIIYGDRTIKGVGGGVCQVSTTLFRTVFFGGFPVVERYSHAYRVSYYEENATGAIDTSMVGLDATVFVPVVDFKFKNDSDYWILMETAINVPARTLTWTFYSTSDGRKVDWQSSGLQNIVAPDEPDYQENPELAAGVIKQVEWEVDGADVTISRTVTRNNQVFFTDQFSTHYTPWRSVFQYGPGTKLPGLMIRP
jgi:vancomycin resistance protein YoaR